MNMDKEKILVAIKRLQKKRDKQPTHKCNCGSLNCNYCFYTGMITAYMNVVGYKNLEKSASENMGRNPPSLVKIQAGALKKLIE